MKTIIEKIIARANALDIALWVEGEQLHVRGHGQIPPRLAEVLKENRAALFAYLTEAGRTRRPVDATVGESSGSNEQEQSIPDEIRALIEQTVLLCRTCLDQNVETPATREHEGFLYCVAHMPMKEFERAERFKAAFPGWQVRLEPRKTLRQQHFEEERGKWRGTSDVPEEIWEQIPRAPVWQKVIDEAFKLGDAFTGLEQDWASLCEDGELDPSVPVDWAKYGYEQRDRDGRLHVNGSPHWELAGYLRGQDGRWYWPAEEEKA